MSEKLSKEYLEIISHSLVITNQMLDTILYNDKNIDATVSFCIAVTIKYVNEILNQVNTEIKGDVKNE